MSWALDEKKTGASSPVNMSNGGSVAKYNRQNSNNVQLEMGRNGPSPTTEPMLKKQESIHRHCIIRQISKNTSTLMKCVVVVSLIFNLLAIPALTAVTVLYFKQSCVSLAPSGAPDLICYPCEDGALPGVPGAEATSNGYCCASKRDGNLKRLIQKNILPAAAPLQQKPACIEVVDEDSSPDEQKHKPHKKKFKLKTVAHLLVKVRATKQGKQLEWTSDSSTGTAFLQGALEMNNATIRVRKGGIYRIQSHFSFDSCENKADRNVTQFDHVVFKRPRVGDVVSLKREKTVLEKNKYLSSDVDLNAKLREGDEIGVSLHTFRYLYELDIANTLDIEKID